MGFRPLWNVFNERLPRDQDAMAFLTELQRAVLQEHLCISPRRWLQGVIATSGWTTASPEYLGPLDKYTNTVADFVDRHGYFGGSRQGPNDGWAVMNTQVYADRSAPAVRPRNAWQAEAVRQPGDGPALRRQAVDDLRKHRSIGPTGIAPRGRCIMPATARCRTAMASCSSRSTPIIGR